MILGVYISIYWMLIGSVFTGLVAYYLNAYYSGPFLNYSILQQIKDILPSFITAFLAAILSYIPVLVFETINWGLGWSKAAFFILPIQLMIGVTIIVIISEKQRIPEYLEIKSIARSQINNKHI